MFFSGIKQVQKPSQAILSVFFNQTDMAVVSRSAFDTAVELNPQIGRNTKILAASKPFVTNVICLNNGMGKEMREKYLKLSLKMHDDVRMFQTFMLFGASRIAAWEPSYIQNVRELVDKHRALPRSTGLLANHTID
jgi:ABC-type phosphate/phosphonate transport system substrate-binding protein